MGVDDGDAVMAVQLSDGASRDLHRHARRHGHPLPRGRRAADGPHRLRRARHPAARGRRSRGDGGGQAGRHACSPSPSSATASGPPLDEYRVQSRGGLGLKNVEITDKNGKVVAIAQVDGDDKELLVITEQGKILRTPTEDIRTIGRATQGVRLMDLEDGDRWSRSRWSTKTEEEVAGGRAGGAAEPSRRQASRSRRAWAEADGLSAKEDEMARDRRRAVLVLAARSRSCCSRGSARRPPARGRRSSRCSPVLPRRPGPRQHHAGDDVGGDARPARAGVRSRTSRSPASARSSARR